MKGLLSLGEVFLSLPLLWTTIHEVLEYFHCKSQDPGHLQSTFWTMSVFIPTSWNFFMGVRTKAIL